jgi:hypothetical protein
MALNWQSDERWIAIVPTGRLTYRIWIDHANSKHVAVVDNYPDVRTLGEFDSLELAQTACESDADSWQK